MNKDEFRLRFSPDIRVNVNWTGFSKNPRVELYEVALSLPRNLNLLWTPWYPGGVSHHPSSADGETLSVLGAASDLSLIGSHVDGILKRMGKKAENEIEAPAVEMTRNRYLLLDKNHSVTAAAVQESSVALRLFVICAPSI